MNNDTFVYVLHINATADQVWSALTEGDFTEKYWGGRRIESDWQVGSSFKHVRPDGTSEVQGQILEADKPRVLSYTWEREGRTPTRVTFKLQYQEPNTRLMLTHEGLDFDPKLENQVTEGWSAILSNLKTLLERGEPMSFPYWRG